MKTLIDTGKLILGGKMSKTKAEGNVTIKDIALMCGVSVSTVSNVLNGKSNKASDDLAARIKETVERVGYKPNYLAKSLRAVNSKTIGVIVEDLIVFSSASIIEGLMSCCEEHGYNVVIENMRLNGRWHGQWMHDQKLYSQALQPVLNKMNSLNTDGIVYIGGHEHKIIGLDPPGNIPFVMAYSYTTNKRIPTFRLDDERGGYEAIKYLMSMGHKEIAILGGEFDNTHTINRMMGVQRAFFEAKELFNPNLVVYCRWNYDGGYEGMKELIDSRITDKVSAVFCMSDAIAAGAYEAIKRAGKVPGEDISIIGYDNQEISSCLYPKLTTMALPLEEIGYQAAVQVIDMCKNAEQREDPVEQKNTKIACKLLERASVKRIEE